MYRLNISHLICTRQARVIDYTFFRQRIHYFSLYLPPVGNRNTLKSETKNKCWLLLQLSKTSHQLNFCKNGEYEFRVFIKHYSCEEETSLKPRMSLIQTTDSAPKFFCGRTSKSDAKSSGNNVEVVSRKTTKKIHHML